MPTTPRYLQAICRACPVRNSADCLVDAQGLRLHNSTNHCPMLTQHTPSMKLSYTRKLFETRAAVHASSYSFLAQGLLPTYQLPKGTKRFVPNRPKPTRIERGYIRKGVTEFISWRQLKRWTAQSNQIQAHMTDKHQTNKSSSKIPINRLQIFPHVHPSPITPPCLAHGVCRSRIPIRK